MYKHDLKIKLLVYRDEYGLPLGSWVILRSAFRGWVPEGWDVGLPLNTTC